MIDHHSTRMTERANYSATLWPKVDELSDYFDGNALGAVDQLLPRATTSTTELLAGFFENVVNGTHPEYLLVCIEGVPRNVEATIQLRLDFGGRVLATADLLRGEHFKYYEIPVSAGITAEHCVGCDTAMGYRFDHMVVCDGDTCFESTEPTYSADRAATIHLVYTPHWESTLKTSRLVDPAQGEQFSRAIAGESGRTFALQNSPNPVVGPTRIEYGIGEAAHVDMRLFSATGELVRTLIRKKHSPGRYSFILDTRGLPTGVYFYRLKAGGLVRAKKLLVLR